MKITTVVAHGIATVHGIAEAHGAVGNDDDYSSSYGGTSHSSGGGSSWGTIITFIIIIAIAYAISSKNKHTPIRPVQTYQPASNFDSEENVERKVKAVDEMFNKEEFLSWTRSLFVKIARSVDRKRLEYY